MTFKRTYQTRISIDASTDEIFSSYAELFAHVEHHLFKAKILNLDPNVCKRTFLKQFGITARQYNACNSILQGKIESIKERQNLRIADLEERAKFLEIKLKKIRNPSVKHQKNRHLNYLKTKLAQQKKDKSENTLRLCFGSKKLFHAQFFLKENGYLNHEEWKKDWEAARKSEFFVLGSKDEANGNQSCRAFLQNDGTLTLQLRLPNALKKHGTYLLISQVRFAYGHQEILTALSSKQALCYRFKRDEKGWRIFLTISTPQVPLITNDQRGTIGIDINTDHLALTETDRFGNPIHKQTLPLVLFGKNKHQSKALIGDVCKNIVKKAEDAKKPIVLEKLNFQKKKTALRENTASYSRTLSAFAYNNIITHIKSRAHKSGIEIKEINPAYTSIIGRVKFSKRYGLSIHHAAALVIARRSTRLSEKLPSRLTEIPDGRGGHVALLLPVRNRNEHVWTLWRKLGKKLSVVLVAHFRAMKNRSLSIQTAHEMLTTPKVIGEIPIHESSEQLLC